MTRLTWIAAAAIAVSPMIASAPSQAATAFQSWAQGRGVYVPSKERLWGFQDDLATVGLFPPPPPPYYRYREMEQRYGVVGRPNDAY